VSDYFGWRIDPFTKKPTRHLGLDITGHSGTPIYATGHGIVTRAEVSIFGYGRYVEVDHGFGYKTRYAHLRKITVKEGQKVKRGEVVGLMGNTGRSTGTHLHYEVRVNNRPVNPLYFYNMDLSPDEYHNMLEHYASIQ
jgi:murein DD-endopeptidase MepM/ murein hydrolase activator NlpD